MIRIVYSDKVEGQVDVDSNSVTYYRDDLFCKEFDDEATAEKFTEAIAVKPQDKEKMQNFLTAMGVSYSPTATNTTLTTLINTFLNESNYPPEWAAGVSLTAGQVIEYLGKWYRVIQSHVTQRSWSPDIVPALFAETSPPTEIPAWKQPAGAHDAYKKGDKVHFPTINDAVYESLIDANVTVPTGDIPYNRYWKPI